VGPAPTTSTSISLSAMVIGIMASGRLERQPPDLANPAHRAPFMAIPGLSRRMYAPWGMLLPEDPTMKPIGAERLSNDEHDRLDHEARVVVAIEEGLADARAGRVVDDEELDDVLRARLGDLID
jgi:hypothetical protein